MDGSLNKLTVVELLDRGANLHVQVIFYLLKVIIGKFCWSNQITRRQIIT